MPCPLGARGPPPTGILAQLALTSHLAQLDLYRRDREQMIARCEVRRSREVRPARLFGRHVVGDHRIGSSPAPQIEEPLAFHRQLELPLEPDGRAGEDWIGPRRGVQPDLVRRPLDRRVVDGHCHTGVPHTSGVLFRQHGIR